MIEILSIVVLFIVLFFGFHILYRCFDGQWKKLETEFLLNIHSELENHFFFTTPKHLKTALYAATLWFIFLAFVLGSVWIGVIGTAAVWSFPFLFLTSLKSRRRKKFENQFNPALKQMISILRAGHSFERALDKVVATSRAPLSQEFGLVSKELRLGKSLDHAMKHLMDRYPSRDLQMVINAIDLSRKFGSNLSEALEKVSDLLSVRSALKDKLFALTAQARMQAWIALVMPILLAGVLYLQAPAFMEPLFFTPKGRFLLLLSTISMTIGGIWVFRISRKEFLQ